MSRERDLGRVVLEVLGGWFEKEIDPSIVAYGLMTIDPTVLPVRDGAQIDQVLELAEGYARPGPITSTAGMAWLRRVIEKAIEFARDPLIGHVGVDDEELAEVMAEDQDVREYAKTRMDHYDCFEASDLESGGIRLFGKTNIGIAELTSGQVANLLASDASSWIDHMYARTDAATEDMDELLRWAQGVTVYLNVGDHPVWVKSLGVLLGERPWVPPARRGEVLTEEEVAQFKAACEEGAEPVFVAVREHVDVAISTSGPAPVTARVWIHLEGLNLRPIQ